MLRRLTRLGMGGLLLGTGLWCATQGRTEGNPPAAAPGLGAAPAVDARYFREKVRPILVGRCLGCHGEASPLAGLDLGTRETLLKGSGTGPVLIPGKAAISRLVQRVADGTMPPKGKLPTAEVEAIRAWVEAGAPWEGERLKPVTATTSERAGLDWWSLQPLKRVSPPGEAKSLPLSPDIPWHSRAVDRFVGRKLKQAGLRFAPEAPREVYIRRVTFDLHGLPPTPQEVEAFVRDRAPGDYERLVDRLLSSPRYGERMARRWLDAVRFAESDGYEHDLPRANAWPYRDWVIEAFNRDLPYDQFVREQLAGDAFHPDDPDAVIPTAFLVAGGHDSVGANVSSEIMRSEVRQDELEDMIGTTMQVFLGMTAQCARCHDHKFDPISQKEYYRISAALAGARHYGPKGKSQYYAVRSEKPAVTRLLQRGSVLAPGAEVTPGALSALRMLPADLAPQADSDPARRRKLAEWLTDPRNPLTPRVAVNRVWGWLFGQGLVATPNDFGFNGDRPSHPELLDFLASSFVAGEPVPQGRYGLAERRGARGQGERGRGTLLTAAGSDSGGSKYAIRNTQYPWSLKRLIRTLVLSTTYRQSSAWNPKAAAVDSGNRLLWRHESRRLESEEVRDTILAVAGRLNPQRGGPGFRLFTFQENAGALYQPVDPEGEEYCRRAIYRMVVRGAEDPLLTNLDCPDPSNTTPRRAATTTATQALSLLNNSFVDRHSGSLAERLRREAGKDPMEQVRLSYRLVFNREPRPDELERVLPFVHGRGLKAWCRVLFNTNEFLYLD